MRVGVWVMALVGCVNSATVVCGDGRTCPAGTLCDEVHRACVSRDQLGACGGAADGALCTIAFPDDGVCDGGVCLAARCGDGYAGPGEVCDGSSFATESNCLQRGFYDDVPLRCDATCAIDESMCTGECGDQLVDGRFELCDGNDPVETCTDFGFGAGVLGCSLNCGPGFDACIAFGWDVAQMPSVVLDLHGTSSTNVC